MGPVDFKSSFRVIIVGCGLGGLAASIGIRKAGFQVLILEQAAEVKEVGKSYRKKRATPTNSYS